MKNRISNEIRGQALKDYKLESKRITILIGYERLKVELAKIKSKWADLDVEQASLDLELDEKYVQAIIGLGEEDYDKHYRLMYEYSAEEEYGDNDDGGCDVPPFEDE